MKRARSDRRFAERPLPIALAAAGGLAVVAAAAYALEVLALRSAGDVATADMRPEAPRAWFRVEADGVRMPPVVAAGLAGLDDAEEVIGVVVGGAARAYRLGVLRDPRRHVVNDLIGATPVSVAYCDRTDCVRTYTGPDGGPLRMGVAGLKDGGLVVKLDGIYYDQRSGRAVAAPPGAAALEHDRIPWTRTTWGRWRREHPTTDVSAGPDVPPANVVEPPRPVR